MQKSKISPEDWILVILMNASEGYGIDLITWFNSKKPDEFEINYGQFCDVIGKMETKRLLKRALFDQTNLCLTDTGKKEAIKLKKKLKFQDYYFIISKFPEIELKERVEIIEVLFIASVLLVLVYFWGKIPVSAYGNNFYIFILILAIFTFFYTLSVFYFTFNFIKIIFFWIVGLQRDTLWIYKEWLWNNRTNLIYPIPAIFVVLLLYELYKMNTPLEAIMLALFMILIEYLTMNYKKVVSEIQLGFEEYLK